MMSKKQDEILVVPPFDFIPISLGLDDVLPVSMVLLVGYNYRIEPTALRKALSVALQKFPHLSGQIQLSLQPLKALIVPSDREVILEWRETDQVNLQNLERLNEDNLLTFFAPSAVEKQLTPMQSLLAPLLQLRLTWLSNCDQCVLGVMASHLALDGFGLALFLNHLTGGMREKIPSVVIHDRQITFPDILFNQPILPKHYIELSDLSHALNQKPESSTDSTTTVFSVHLEDLKRCSGKQSLTDARFYLAAHLCLTVAEIQPSRRTLALWCNTRGFSHVPRNYTGNTGCYIHIPLEPGETEQCFQLLKNTITRKGFSEIVETYSKLKAAESQGRMVFWNGPGEDLISVNLVPSFRDTANFGEGTPIYAELLTRNVSGIRIYSNPDGKRIVVEASFSNQICQRLRESLEELGLPIQLWHQDPFVHGYN